jgi:hypothetical protein
MIEFIIIITAAIISLVINVICMLLLLLVLLSSHFSVRMFWKLLVSVYLLGISRTLHCLVFVRHVAIVPLLDVHQLLILFAGMLTYLKSGTFSSIVSFNI